MLLCSWGGSLAWHFKNKVFELTSWKENCTLYCTANVHKYWWSRLFHQRLKQVLWFSLVREVRGTLTAWGMSDCPPQQRQTSCAYPFYFKGCRTQCRWKNRKGKVVLRLKADPMFMSLLILQEQLGLESEGPLWLGIFPSTSGLVVGTKDLFPLLRSVRQMPSTGACDYSTR